MSLKCPFLGTEKSTDACERPCKNLRGLKSHLTRAHGEWTAEQVAAATAELEAQSQAQGEENNTEPGLPLDTEQEAQPDPNGAPAPTVRERSNRSEGPVSSSKQAKKAALRLSQALSSVKIFIAKLLPPITAQFIRDKFGIVGELSAKGSEVIAEAWAAYFDFLGFDMENAEPVKIKVSGKKMMLLWPLAMLGLTFGFMVSNKKSTPENQKSQEAASSEETKHEIDQ